VPRADLTEAQLDELVRWARKLNPAEWGHRGAEVIAVVSELRTLRERESNTRMLMEIEGEV
jgi:hypothetical protein